MFNGVYEWTISRYSSGTGSAFRVNGDGNVNYNIVSSITFAVRPVFYLKSDVSIIKDQNFNGSKERPYRIAI